MIQSLLHICLLAGLLRGARTGFVPLFSLAQPERITEVDDLLLGDFQQMIGNTLEDEDLVASLDELIGNTLEEKDLDTEPRSNKAIANDFFQFKHLQSDKNLIKALPILDQLRNVSADDSGKRCIKKIMMREETEYEEVVTCHHSYDERCHQTFVTIYEPHQEEECDEKFKKECMIWHEEKAVSEMVEECTTPLVPDCDFLLEEECNIIYDTVCTTRQVGYEVEEDFPNCTTVNMEKCEDVTVGLQTERKCEVWPTQRCSVDTKTVQHSSPNTQCRKEPRKMCSPGDCPHKTGPVQCLEKMKTVMVETPQEQCDLEPQKLCTTVTKMVPQLRRSKECVDVPKEVCAMSRVNPTIRKVPFKQNWCFKPEEVDLQNILKLA